jgi:hypothetical protein
VERQGANYWLYLTEQEIQGPASERGRPSAACAAGFGSPRGTLPAAETWSARSRHWYAVCSGALVLTNCLVAPAVTKAEAPKTDPDIYDDADFYQQLLKDLLETTTSGEDAVLFTLANSVESCC